MIHTLCDVFDFSIIFPDQSPKKNNPMTELAVFFSGTSKKPCTLEAPLRTLCSFAGVGLGPTSRQANFVVPLKLDG